MLKLTCPQDNPSSPSRTIQLEGKFSTERVKNLTMELVVNRKNFR